MSSKRQSSAHDSSVGRHVRFHTPAQSFGGTLNTGAISQAMAERLPISATVQRWGEEIYFDVPVKMKNTQPTRNVKIGDIGYWPDGPSLCIFFGKTPASKGHEPRAGSDVTIVGHTDAGPALLRSIAEGTTITLTRASPSSTEILRNIH